jgi:hypothetical protein
LIDLTGIKIGYVPYSKNLDAPGDRRRFIFYANERGVKFERANYQSVYDVVYLTYGCDLAAWIAYKKCNPSVKIVFELIDSYLFQETTLITALKGVVRYVMGRESKLYLSYKSALVQIISISDAVVCSTDLQKNHILKLNGNIHVSLDYFSDDITSRKKMHKSGSKVRLVWEGQAYTVKNLLLLNDVLNKIKDKIEIFVITDQVASYYLNLYKVKTVRVLKKFKCNYHLVPWNRRDISDIISSCDLALIPIAPGDNFSLNKPENKLLFFWEIGIPTLTSNTPAYMRVMNQAGLDLYCSTPEEWLSKIELFANASEKYRQEIVDVANNYIQTYHTKEIILKKWDSIFKSILSPMNVDLL